jgi:hypothetical protein
MRERLIWQSIIQLLIRPQLLVGLTCAFPGSDLLGCQWVQCLQIFRLVRQRHLRGATGVVEPF